MLQQTQASRVEPIFEVFMARFPDPRSLAAASLGEVLDVWGGLGYHRRVRALHRAAAVIVEEHGGRTPREVDALRALPGVGPYTASAVASIAFGAPLAAVDTNVRRIVARAGEGVDPDELGSAAASVLANAWLDTRDPGRWNEALMDLGRERCRPVPQCGGCPLEPWCAFAARGGAMSPPRPRSTPFEGSSRQARGRVIAALRPRSSAATLPQLVRITGIAHARVAAAVESLLADGLVERSAAGRLRLPR